jgi:hypothetical protein
MAITVKNQHRDRLNGEKKSILLSNRKHCLVNDPISRII